MSVTSAGKRPGVSRLVGVAGGRPRLTLVPPVATPAPARPDMLAGQDMPARQGAAGDAAVLPAGAVPRPRVPLDAQPARGTAQPARGTAQPARPQPGQRVRRAGAARPDGHRTAGRRPVRLTRRGRCVLWVAAGLILAAILVPVLLMASTGAQASSHGVPASAVRAGMRPVKVQPGDSLWSIALRAEPKADPRVVSQQIIQFNALSGSVLVPGETLWVPRG